MPLPEVDSTTGNLPEGDHVATWDELDERFGVDPRRRRRLRDLRVVLDDLVWPSGSGRVWIDGSFITLIDYPEAGRPRDIDVCYEAVLGHDPLNWTDARRQTLWKRRKVDLMPSYTTTNRFDRTPILDRFRVDEEGRARGTVVLLNELDGGQDD